MPEFDEDLMGAVAQTGSEPEPERQEVWDLETEYDAVIKPLVDKVYEACDKLGLPAVLVFQVKRDAAEDFGRQSICVDGRYRAISDQVMVIARMADEAEFAARVVELVYLDKMAQAVTQAFGKSLENERNDDEASV